MEKQEKSVYEILGKRIRMIVESVGISKELLREIRIRVGQPLELHTANGTLWPRKAYRIDKQDIEETLEYISRYSLYAYEEEIKQGFLTLPGGHRVGICGRSVMENGILKNIKQISALNIRIAHAVIGCSDELIPWLKDGKRLYSALFIAPPGAGKTTMLRDAVRQLSNDGSTVSIIDERSEIAGCYRGIPQQDVGVSTDVLDACPKAEGMLLMLRTMSPELIAVDEIGKEEDYKALQYVMNCGCKVLATVHGYSYEEQRQKLYMKDLVDIGLFSRYIVLQKQDRFCVKEIRDEKGKIVWESV